MFIVEKGTPGSEVGPKEDKMGAQGVGANVLFFDDVQLREEKRLGEEETGFKVTIAALNDSRPIMAARGVGLAHGAMDHAAKFILWSGDLRLPGSPLDDCGYGYSNRGCTQPHLRGGNRGRPELAVLRLARLPQLPSRFATDTAMKVATDAVQLFGTAGISNDYPINRYFRDAKVLQIIEGTNQIQRDIVANSVLPH